MRLCRLPFCEQGPAVCAVCAVSACGQSGCKVFRASLLRTPLTHVPACDFLATSSSNNRCTTIGEYSMTLIPKEFTMAGKPVIRSSSLPLAYPWDATGTLCQAQLICTLQV